MDPLAKQINATRYIIIVIVRGIAFFALVFGAVSLSCIIISELMWYDDNALLKFGASLIAPAAVMAIWNRQIVNWIVPAPRAECPQCGYETEHLQSEHCPECGYRIAPKSQEAATTLPFDSNRSSAK